MSKKPNGNTFTQLLKGIQEYWFLITLLFSAFAAIFYFIYFDVNPLEKQYENKIQTLHVGLHNNIAVSLLKQGYYEDAKEEYQKALEYKSYNKEALNGKLLTDLFLNLKSLDQNPALADKLMAEVSKLEIDEEDELYTIRKKLYADLELHKGNQEEALNLYDQLLETDSSYVDLLNNYGWIAYDSDTSNLQKMEKLFDKMIDVAPNDYRGYHGYGYALYMRAMREENAEYREELLFNAGNECINAINLVYSRFNVLLDLGEIIRSVRPDIAVSFHLQAQQLLDDEALMNLEENRQPLGYKLLLTNGNRYIVIPTLEQKKALVLYELALDYLADYRLNYEITSYAEFNEMLDRAEELDKNGNMKLIFEDQWAALNLFLPEE